jgi:curved DNA-binding protein CbpA
MEADVRREQRRRSKQPYTLSWEANGLTRSVRAEGLDVSPSGVGLQCSVELQPGTSVYIEAHDGSTTGYSVVRHCTRRDTSYVIGLELEQETNTGKSLPGEDAIDYYELLQISQNAELSTIERVYRFLVARYHPDNPTTGDPEQFILLARAFKVLSHPDRRAEYDAGFRARNLKPNNMFQSIDFMDGVEGEVNRRVAVLALLYNQCRTHPDNPRVSLADLEARMGFPREYLDFTTWYLRSKKYITREDNSDFALTASGVDYVEANYTKSPILNQLLNSGCTRAEKSSRRDARSEGRGRHEELFMLGSGEKTRNDSEASARNYNPHGLEGD